MNAQIHQPTPQSGVSFVSTLASLSVAAGLLAIVLPAPATAANDYDRCTSDLLGAKITTEEAASACSRAFAPRDLSSCVSQLSGNTFAAADALNACRQVRRPREMATCVVDIRREVTDSTAAEVLDSCRRSLLPKRYSDCVVGVNRAAKVPPTQALDSCVDASYFPREVDPTFLPFTPSGGVSVTPLQTETPLQTSPAPEVTSPAPTAPATTTPAQPIPQLY
ncbi:hypothetical protein H6F76_28365 [Leptolyngbya sp. FACHB-321]|uniref:hypothetical protein n=1 Tax=Leptolyngbya sp. FACHB-321 TaxID=2692807 RepID=UPI001685AF26|nr:hypothetical protein [Leptolyngbya sp. FACHB-321]MBD2038868.1 hypothetical protein [Leptolyngbya sp. FACHB-321]